VTVDELPSLVRTADAAAVRAERSYFTLLRIEMVLLILGAAASAVAATISESSVALASLSCILASLLLGIFSRQQRYEDGWFDWRAVAETAKSLAWHYVTRCSPFDQPTAAAADEELARALRGVLQGHRRADEAFLGSSLAEPQITQAMRSARAASLPLRVARYRERLRAQRRWYAERAALLERRDARWYLAYVVAQAAAAALALGALFHPVPEGFVAVATTVASATIAWHEARRYRDLASAYAMAAQELGLIDPLFDHVDSEAALQRRVGEAEAAISREHTMWLGRRG
jgi:hypothetical protein